MGSCVLIWWAFIATNIPVVHTLLMAIQSTFDLELEEPRKRYEKIGRLGELQRSILSKNCTNWPSSSSVRAILPYAKWTEQTLVTQKTFTKGDVGMPKQFYKKYGDKGWAFDYTVSAIWNKFLFCQDACQCLMLHPYYITASRTSS